MDLSCKVSVVPSRNAVDSVADGAIIAIQSIKCWRNASTDHPVLKKYIQDIQKQGADYCKAIGISVKAVQEGCDTDSNTIDLCETLLSPNSGQEEIRQIILNMQGNAKRAHQGSRDTWDKFKSLRTSLVQTTKEILYESFQLTQSDARKAKAEILRLPFLGRVEDNKRDVEFYSSIAVLNRAVQDLWTLIDSVSAFAAWWGTMETNVTKAGCDADALEAGKVIKLRIKSMQRDWQGIKDDYMQYKNKIGPLVQHY